MIAFVNCKNWISGPCELAENEYQSERRSLMVTINWRDTGDHARSATLTTGSAGPPPH